MPAVWLVARAHLRRHWRSAVLVGLLAAVGGAAVLAAGDGVGRTRSAVQRLDAATATPDAFVFLPFDEQGQVDPQRVAQVDAIPEVEAVAPWATLLMRPEDLDLPPGRELDVGATAGTDARLGRDVLRPRIIDGRRARPERAEETILNEDMADALRVTAGDTVRFVSFTPDQAAAFEATGVAPGEPAGPKVDLEVVGIGRTSADLTHGENFDNFPVLLTPAFYERYGAEIASLGEFLVVKLSAPGDAATLPAAIAEAGVAEAEMLSVAGDEVAELEPSIRQAIDTESVALLAFAAVVAVANLLAIAQAFGRQAAASTTDQATLRALGLSPMARVGAAAVAALPVALGGAALAVVGAVAVSPLLPIGLAGRANPDPGVHVDPLVMTVGAVGIIVVVLALAVAATWRVSRLAVSGSSGAELGDSPRQSVLLRRLAGARGVSPVATTGVRMALEPGRARGAVPVRPALVGSVVGVGAVVAALVIGASLDRLVESPDRYGWNWDVAVAAGSEPQVATRIAERLASEPNVTAVAAVDSGSVEVRGVPVPGAGFSPVSGSIEPTVVEGRAPRAYDEIALGSDTLERVGAAIGDAVAVGADGEAQELRVAGRVVLPPIDSGAEPANGAVVAGDLGRVASPAGPDRGQSNVAVRFAPGIDHDAAIGRLQDQGLLVATTVRPVDVDTLASVKALPFVLAGVLGALAVLALAHALVTSVRRRRPDLAVLETLGFVRRQVKGVVAWQATTVALVGVALGVPLGLAGGRWGWAALAGGIGMATDPDFRVVAVLLVAVLTPVLANVVAAMPARAATRTRPASVLRAE